MGETLSFVVRIPRQALSDFALNINGTDLSGAGPADFSECLKDAILAGLEEYLDQDDIPERIDVRHTSG